MGTRVHENGFHSRAPSQSNVSDAAFDDAASFHSAAAQQHASSSLHGPGQDGKRLSVQLQQISDGADAKLSGLPHVRLQLPGNGKLSWFKGPESCQASSGNARKRFWTDRRKHLQIWE